MPRPYRLGKREETIKHTRSRILRAATYLFSRGGFHRTSVDAVAKRANVSRPTVYYQFGSKAGLLDGVIGDAERRTGLDQVVRAAEQGDPRRAVKAMLREWARYWATEPDFFRSAMMLAHADPELRELIETREANRRKLGGRLVKRLADEGALREGWTPKKATDLIYILTAYRTIELLLEGGRTPQQVASFLTEIASSAFKLS